MIGVSLLSQGGAAILIALSATQAVSGCPCHAEPPPSPVPAGPDGPILCDEHSPLVWFCPVTVPIVNCPPPPLADAIVLSPDDLHLPKDEDACLIRDRAGIGRPLLYRWADLAETGHLGVPMHSYVWIAGWLP